MIVLLDACTLINLANGGVLAPILNLEDVEFHLSSFVRNESQTLNEVIDQLLDSGHLTLAEDDLIPFSAFREGKSRMGLGDGETECILIASILGYSIACDDGRARRKAIETLGGEERVTGSIGLLKIACDRGILTPKQATDAVVRMRECGGYLPAINDKYFG